MRKSYLDYAMSVIVSRALPDVRDGLKPVHRRILYAMKEGGYDSTKAYKKSARIVGDVMGKYHPHGDSAIYDAMVRMAQDFSMRLPLIDGQGNFGSMDGDPAAAMRYTEARLNKAAESLLDDIDRDTVDFHPNYDESVEEPDVLPARFPNLLVNGGGGIAVGMATNIPPHNLGEVIAACCALIDNPDATLDELIQLVPAPDFPTGGVILGRSGARSALETGRGSVVMRGKAEIEEIRKDREAVVITEVPYQVNKARMIEQIAEAVQNKVIEGISDLRDESDRDGVRVVVELKREAVGEVVLNQLYKHTDLQTSFGVNTLALNGGRPEMMNLKTILQAFIKFREEVITRRTEFELGKARERAHVLAGLAVAVANIDEMIALIRKAADPNVAREQLCAKAWAVKDVGPLIALIDEPGRTVAADGTYRLSEIQARAILDLRLHRLTGLERDKIGGELKEVTDNIREFLSILSDRPKRMALLRGELVQVGEQFGTPRRTRIDDADGDVDIEDLIQREDMVVTVTQTGYIKRVPLSAYRAQARGGKGRSGMTMKDEDSIIDLFVASTHAPVLFFSTRGIAYVKKVYQLPLGNAQSKGKAMVNLLPLQEGEKIATMLCLPEDESTWGNLHAVFATSKGNVRRNRLSDFTSIRANGLIAMKFEEADESLIAVKTCTEQDNILLCTHQGKAIRFEVADVRVFSGRTSTGVRGIKLGKDDEVISMSILRHVDATAEERAAYLRQAAALRRTEGETEDAASADEGEESGVTAITLSPERFRQLAAQEEFLLTVSERGFGKRSSAYDYRITGRGGSGLWAMNMSERNGAMVAAFPVDEKHQIMLVTDAGQMIRMPVHDIRIARRSTQGVTLFRIEKKEKVVSVAMVEGEDEAEAAEGRVE
ncbi:MAG: DNA gyrase subunit A [Pseudomonadota bacterium]|nr:DNA gyrase subunit A [Pseudomonadota bacterium]